MLSSGRHCGSLIERQKSLLLPLKRYAAAFRSRIYQHPQWNQAGSALQVSSVLTGRPAAGAGSGNHWHGSP